MSDRKIYIFLANYGSGKTEFTLNYAIKLREQQRKVAIADIDVVNLYFRSRDQKEMFEKAGITVISSHKGYEKQDSPSISSGVWGYISNKEYDLVLDVGGDSNGATVLGSMSDDVKKYDYEANLIVNTNRPFTRTVEEIIALHGMLEEKSKLKITALVNNTNLQEFTTVEDIKKGERIVDLASVALDIPLVCNGVSEDLYDKVDGLRYEKFKIRRFMNKPWEKKATLPESLG